MTSIRLRLIEDRRASVAIEFGLLAPTLIAMMLGVFQVGVGMHNYSALRGLTADTARHAMVKYQDVSGVDAFPDDVALEDWARSRATAAPYGLTESRLTVNVLTVATPRIAGALEKTVTVQYTVPSVLSIVGLNDITINYSQPVFLLS